MWRYVGLFLWVFCWQTNAVAEINALPGGDTRPPSFERFYREGSINAQYLATQCGLDKIVDVNLQPQMPPECVGYFRAFAGPMLHGDRIRHFMTTDQCINLGPVLPDFTLAAIITFSEHIQTADFHAGNVDAFEFLTQSIIQDFSCNKAAPSEYDTYGILPVTVKK